MRVCLFPRSLIGRRHVSYHVSKARTLEWWKNDDSAIQAEFKRSHNMLFIDQKVLLNKAKSSHNTYSIAWLPHAKLNKIFSQHQIELKREDAVLLDAVPMQSDTNDVFEEWEPMMAYGLKLGSPELQQQLIDTIGAHLVDLRFAIFAIGTEHDAKLISKAQSLLRWCKIFKHCPKCGSRLTAKVSKALASCQKCSRQYHPPVTPVALCLVVDQSNDHCVLVRQPRHIPGVFTAVAGFTEPGETLEDTVVREVAEEVGLDVINVKYMQQSQHWPFPSSSLMCAYVATADRQQQPDIDRSELEDAKWFSREEVKVALDKTIADPLFKTIGEKPFSHLPPAGTLSHQLIKSWVQQTL